MDRTYASPQLLARAQEIASSLGDGYDVEVDDETPGTLTSEGDGGTWVRAWVWVPEPDEDDACPDDPDGLHHVGCGCER